MVSNFFDWIGQNAQAWSVASSLATVVSLLVALLAAGVAYLAFLQNRRASSDAHMHGLFKDYLLKEMDLISQSHIQPSKAQPADLIWMRHTLTHHVMEEMFIWLRKQWPSREPFIFKNRFERRMDYLLGWESAMKAHLLKQQDGIDYLIEARRSYEMDYLLFVADVLQRNDLYEALRDRPTKWRRLIRLAPPKPTLRLAADQESSDMTPAPPRPHRSKIAAGEQA